MKLADLTIEDIIQEDKDFSFFLSTLLPAFADEYIARVADGSVTIPDWNDSYGLYLFDYIKDFIENGNQRSKNMAVYRITDAFHSSINHVVYMIKQFIADGEEDKAKLLLESFKEGTLSMPSSLMDCEIKKDKISIKLNKWNMSFSTINPKSRALVEFVPDSTPKVAIYSAKVNFPTGSLLVMDWLRIDDFINSTKDIKYEGEPIDINNEEGQIELVKRYLKNGFLSVHVGNSCPSIFNVDGQLVIGQLDYDPDEDDRPDSAIGMVCTDLWWATVIDREDAIRIIKLTNPDASDEHLSSKIDEYAKERTVTMVTVEPGEYNVYFNTFNENTTDKQYESIKMDQDHMPDIKPNIIISKDELSFGNKVIQFIGESIAKKMKI